MKFFSTLLPYNFNWDQVAVGLWQRYPNPKSKHVLTEDVVSRVLVGKKIFTKRLLTKKYNVPKWGRDGPKWYVTAIIEESVVDPVKKTMTTYTRNIDLKWFINVVEKCVYTVDPENRCKVIQEKSFWNTSKVFGFGRAIELYGYVKAKKDAQKTHEGFIQILEKLFPSDTFVPATVLATTGKERIKQTHGKATEMAKDATEKAKDKAKSRVFVPNS
ncbi:Protein preli-like,PRELI domain-containing protein 1, mitochondrial [Mytilus edulis]|uniref:Protein preli-like,PRELI domain-containing protein 1, mitochondrial n=1 Tax=Mytilus edulis TaxID=6550 RepID=A0A8S3Q5G2_MYTED|nr:Protein preli-like,PRELI domain-containing protein 1, mitochondrial [Mytilus edulis]